MTDKADWLVGCQVILLSATMPADVLEVTKRFMREPVRILVKKEELTLEGIRQFYIEVEQEVWEFSGTAISVLMSAPWSCFLFVTCYSVDFAN